MADPVCTPLPIETLYSLSTYSTIFATSVPITSTILSTSTVARPTPSAGNGTTAEESAREVVVTRTSTGLGASTMTSVGTSSIPTSTAFSACPSTSSVPSSSSSSSLPVSSAVESSQTLSASSAASLSSSSSLSASTSSASLIASSTSTSDNFSSSSTFSSSLSSTSSAVPSTPSSLASPTSSLFPSSQPDINAAESSTSNAVQSTSYKTVFFTSYVTAAGGTRSGRRYASASAVPMGVLNATSGKGGTPSGAIAGGVVGGVAALALILAVLIIFLRKKKRNRQSAFLSQAIFEPDHNEKFEPGPGIASSTPAMAGVGGVLAGSRRLSWGRSGSSAGGTSVGGANGAGVGAGMAVAAEEDRGWRRRSGLEYDDELEEEGYGGVSSFNHNYSDNAQSRPQPSNSSHLPSSQSHNTYVNPNPFSQSQRPFPPSTSGYADTPSWGTDCPQAQQPLSNPFIPAPVPHRQRLSSSRSYNQGTSGWGQLGAVQEKAAEEWRAEERDRRREASGPVHVHQDGGRFDEGHEEGGVQPPVYH